jgi:hypothetical protein
VLKAYHAGRAPDERDWTVLRRRRSGYLLDLVDAGHAGRRAYEVAEHLAGGDLQELRRRHPEGLNESTLTRLVEQIATALMELHGKQVVHRDVKPTNLMLRRRQAVGRDLDVVLIDFGIAVVTDGEFHPSSAATTRYAPPEWPSGYVSAATDWWALGITLVELATGRHPFEGLDTDPFLAHLATRPVDVSAVRFPRVRSLCRGLLTRDPRQRWSGDQVWRWVRREDPPVVHDVTAPSDVPELEPLRFRDQLYRRRDLLAIAMAEVWEATAAQYLGRGGRAHLDRLAAWLGQFPEYVGEDGAARLAWVRTLRDAKGTPNPKLLHLLRELDPARVPIYRHEAITRIRLRELAELAVGSGGLAREVVADLWSDNLLPVLDTTGAEDARGIGLTEVDHAWRSERGRWPALVAAVADPEAQAELRTWDQRVVGAVCLWAATMSEAERNRLADDGRRAARRFRPGLRWYDALVAVDQNRLALVAARLLHRLAEQQATERQAIRDVRRWERANQRLARWSRRQSRVVALGWAVAGTAMVAALWMFLIGSSDSAQVASDAAVTDGWVGSVLATGVVLAVEAVLATLVGARYPLRYSLPAAGLIALRPLAARARQHGIAAFFVILAVVAAVGAVSVGLPQVVPALTALLILVWAVQRHGAWLREVRQEETVARDEAEAERRRRDEDEEAP